MERRRRALAGVGISRPTFFHHYRLIIWKLRCNCSAMRFAIEKF